MLPQFLKSIEAQKVYQLIRESGLYVEEYPVSISADEKTFIIAENNIRNSKYEEITTDIPANASEWVKRLAVCTGYLFTAPLSALKELDFLEKSCTDSELQLRLRVWRMHLSLLVGFDEIGRNIRESLRTSEIDLNPWQIEIKTLLAISFFSTAECAKAIEMHQTALKLIANEPEQYFMTFGSALGMRAALKICDAQAFDFFSRNLDEALMRKPDNRYQLRQLGYRAMVLTQLGETELAHDYWTQGDVMLQQVSPY